MEGFQLFDKNPKFSVCELLEERKRVITSTIKNLKKITKTKILSSLLIVSANRIPSHVPTNLLLVEIMT